MKRQKAGKTVLKVFSFMLVFIILIGVMFFLSITKDTRLDKTAIAQPYAKAEIYDNNIKPVEYTSQVTKHVPYAEISENIIKPFIILEDKRFYSHNGIDYLRLTKASLNNIKAGYFKEGGSTITQQLAKNTLLSNEKSINRKLKEAKLARQIENEFSKEEIITMYLNAIYFGNGIYGIEQACQQIFNKQPSELTLAEGAMLAGIVKNPRDNSPLSFPDNANKRKDLVLRVMKKESAITESEYEQALKFKYIPIEREKSYNSYSSSVLEEASQILGISERALISNNYKIYTYGDTKKQQSLEYTFKNQGFAVDNADYLALIADNQSCGIVAYCASFNHSIFNLRRQPGSAIKPIAVYAPALKAGYINPATQVLDEKVDIGGYSPSNYGGIYNGWTSIRQAVASSSNVVAVKLLNEIGVDYGKYIARQMGIRFEAQDELAMALGGMTKGVTAIEITEAYMTLANKGGHDTLSFVKEIRDVNDKIIYKRKQNAKNILSEESSYLMTDMLVNTAKNGTARKMSALPFQVAAKTGTVGDVKRNTDAWNMSYTTENTMCIWYGSLNNDNHMAKNITGGSYPTMLASYIYSSFDAPKSFDIPIGITTLDIDKYATQKEHRLLLASPSTPTEYRKSEYFDINHLPDDVSTQFDNVIPIDLKAEMIDGKARISMTPKKGFVYKIYKLEDNIEQLLAIFDENQVVVYEDPHTNFGFNTYYVSAYTTDGIMSGKSPSFRIFSFNLF